MHFEEQRYARRIVGRYGEIDPTDVPLVTVRELAVALKFLADGDDALMDATRWSDQDFRRLEQLFWKRCGRDRLRKTAVLVRLRELIAVSRSRMLKAILARHGSAAAMCLVEATACMRLNTSVGFSPNKLAWAVMAALKRAEQSPEQSAKLSKCEGGPAVG